MIKLNRTTIIVIPFIVFATNAYSKNISYDYVQATYSSITDSGLGFDVDGDGFAVSGSFSVTPNIAVGALFGSTSYDDIFGVTVDATELNFGLVAHTSVSPGTDIFGSFSVVNAEVELSDGFNTLTDDDTGNAIGAGIRSMISDKVEVNVALARVDIFDDSATDFGLGARFYVDQKISLGVAYVTGDDVDTLLLSARLDLK